MAKARALSELADEVGRALSIVDEKLPLLIPTTAAPVTETEREDRLNLRKWGFDRVLAELLDNQYE